MGNKGRGKPASLAGKAASWGKSWAKRMGKALPKGARHALYRRMAKVPPPGASSGLELKLAESSAELGGCFALLHDAYVSSGFMERRPSGLRVTPYHALPTTTTLCAKQGGAVVGTVTIVREGAFGLPMGEAFELAPLRAVGGRIAEISSLAVAEPWRGTSGAVLFPMMKFLYEYCVEMFDVRHLAIAVNPKHIELYEALLGFRRLAGEVASYGFANGAPAVGAWLDLDELPKLFGRLYRGASRERDLGGYILRARDEAIEKPERGYFVTNDPVMTPELLREFFVDREDVLSKLGGRRVRQLREIYAEAGYGPLLPGEPERRRGHPRHSIKCPALARSGQGCWRIDVEEASRGGFMASCRGEGPPECFDGEVAVEVASGEFARLRARCVRSMARPGGAAMSFVVDSADESWTSCVEALEAAGGRSVARA